MKRWFHTFMIIPLLMMLTSCGYQVPLEDTTIVLILGIDLDEDNNLIFYESSPVFNKERRFKPRPIVQKPIRYEILKVF